MRKFLYSRWFFLFLAVTCVIDLVTDLVEEYGWIGLNHLSIVLDVIILFMALWMFVDLQRRRPRDGGNSRR